MTRRAAGIGRIPLLRALRRAAEQLDSPSTVTAVLLLPSGGDPQAVAQARDLLAGLAADSGQPIELAPPRGDAPAAAVPEAMLRFETALLRDNPASR